MNKENLDCNIHISFNLDQQIEIDEDLIDIQHNIDEVVKKAYLMGYTQGLKHQENTPYFP